MASPAAFTFGTTYLPLHIRTRQEAEGFGDIAAGSVLATLPRPVRRGPTNIGRIWPRRGDFARRADEGFSGEAIAQRWEARQSVFPRGGYADGGPKSRINPRGDQSFAPFIQFLHKVFNLNPDLVGVAVLLPMSKLSTIPSSRLSPCEVASTRQGTCLQPRCRHHPRHPPPLQDSAASWHCLWLVPKGS